MKKLLLLSAFALSGCGVGAGAMIHNVSIGPDKGTFKNINYTRELNVISPVISIYDSTGILASAFGGAGAAYTADREARDAAIRGGAETGDTYTYSYDVPAPAINTMTSVSFAWGSTDTLILPDSETEQSDDISFFAFDMTIAFNSFEIVDPLNGQFRLGTTWWSYSNDRDTADGMWIGMPLTFALIYDTGIFDLVPTAFISIDPLVSGILFLLAEDDAPWFWYQTGLELNIPLLDFLSISTKAFFGETPMDMGYNESTSYGVNASLVLFATD